MYQAPPNIDEALLRSDVAILCGGRDVVGCPLVIFPVDSLHKLEQLSVASVVQLIRYYGKVTRLSEQSRGFSFLADLQTCGQNVIQLLADLLIALHTDTQGSVATLYVLRPKSGSRHRFMKKILGVKESKKCPRLPVCKTVVVKSHAELYTHVSRANLTEGYGGMIRHNQEAWIRFYKMVSGLTESLHKLMPRLPAARDKVQLLQEYEASATSTNELADFLKDLHHKYNAIVSDLDLEATIDGCRQVIQQLDAPSDPYLHHLPTTLLIDTKSHLHVSMTTLVTSRGELVDLWRELEACVTARLQLAKYRDQATELNSSIVTDWLCKVDSAPVLSCTLSHAENQRNHFLSTIYEPSKTLVAKATSVLKGVHDIKTAMKCEDMTFVESLSNTVHTFVEKLEHNNKIYISLHIFFLMFEKLALWYQKVLRFLPTSLSRYVDRAKRKKQASFAVLPKWTQAARGFLDKHPSPREEHIGRIDKPNVELPDQQICSQAQLLAQRIRILMGILSSNEHFCTSDILDALTWKKLAQKGEDAIVFPHEKNQSTPSDIDSARDNSNSQDLLERPATALGITEKKPSTVTFASDVTDGDLQEAKPALKTDGDLNKSLDNEEFAGLDFRRHSISIDKQQAKTFVGDDRTSTTEKYWHRQKRSRSIDNLADMENFRSSKDALNDQERFISLNFHHDQRNSPQSSFPSQNAPEVYQIFPEHFHGNSDIHSPPMSATEDTSMVESSDGTSVVLRLHDIMNSGMAPEVKVQQAQLLLQQEQVEKQSAAAARMYKKTDRQSRRSQSPKYNNYLTKSMPNLDQVDSRRSPISYLSPPVYSGFTPNIAHRPNFHSSYHPEFYPPGTNFYPQQFAASPWERAYQNVDDWMRRQNENSAYESDDGFSDGSQLAPVLKRQMQRFKQNRRSSRTNENGDKVGQRDDTDTQRDDARNQQEYYLRRHKLQMIPPERRLSCPLYIGHPSTESSPNTQSPGPDSDLAPDSTDRGYVSSEVFLRDHPLRRSRPRRSGKVAMQRKESNDSATSSDMSFMNQAPGKCEGVAALQYITDEDLDDSAPVVIHPERGADDVVDEEGFIGGKREGKMYGSDRESRTYGNDKESRTYGNDKEIRTYGNDKESRTYGNDKESRTYGNDKESRTYGNDKESRKYGNDKESRTFGNDKESRTYGNDKESRTYGNDKESRTYGNDKESRTYGNDKESRTFGNDKESRMYGDVKDYHVKSESLARRSLKESKRDHSTRDGEEVKGNMEHGGKVLEKRIGAGLRGSTRSLVNFRTEEPKTKGILKTANVDNERAESDMIGSVIDNSGGGTVGGQHEGTGEKRSGVLGKTAPKKMSRNVRNVTEACEVSGKMSEEKRQEILQFMVAKEKSKNASKCENDFKRFRAKWSDRSTRRSVNIDEAIKERKEAVKERKSSVVTLETQDDNEDELFKTIEIKPLKSKLLEPVLKNGKAKSGVKVESLTEKCEIQTFIETGGETFA